MLVRNQKTFNLGLIMAISFVGVLIVIFSPIFGGGKNGLEFSDDLFNKLSKGSSYFIPELTQSVEKFKGKTFSVSVNMEKPDQAKAASEVFLTLGAQVGLDGSKLQVSGDVGRVLGGILADSDAMYKDDGKKISDRYGKNEKDVVSMEWTVLNKAMKELQKQKQIEEADIISEVMKKGIEPAFNFYGIPAQSVADKAFTMTALLIFYVLYTMWWGYAIFYMFDGLGLSMKKAKVKKEV